MVKILFYYRNEKDNTEGKVTILDKGNFYDAFKKFKREHPGCKMVGVINLAPPEWVQELADTQPTERPAPAKVENLKATPGDEAGEGDLV